MGAKKAYKDSIGAALEKSCQPFTSAVAFYAGIRLIQTGHVSFPNLFIAISTTMTTSQQVGMSSTFVSALHKGRTAAQNVSESLCTCSVLSHNT